ncbi:class A beta-lactamase-related serine hydrolase [Membranicola marinus]|uniref:beta-lactamase n=1 Tax=Membranihabitans marinus TaxID=1227546 RepID=A0A953HPB7_9BACT|nr:serine hydrolase [Membranihabitans marinus]MBY5958328.1 class A beta-lactamase-related serine hydrolase [Membranihabitans marinus]
MNRHTAFLSSIIFILIWLQACETGQTPTLLRDSIHAVLDSVEGDFAIAYMDMQTGDTISLQANEVFHAASTMKTPVMIEAYKQRKEQGQKMTDSIVVYNKFYSIVDKSEYHLTPENDSDPELYDLLNQKISWVDLIDRMITRSSNLATNILIDQLGAENVTKSMRRLGANKIQVLRGVEDLKAYEAGLSNTTTALDLLHIYEKLAQYQVVDSSSSQAMIDVLLNQEFNTLIPAPLPDVVQVAHKTGSITGVHHDSGIIILPDGRKYVLVMLSKNVSDMEKADQAMVEVSRLIYDHFINLHTRSGKSDQAITDKSN